MFKASKIRRKIEISLAIGLAFAIIFSGASLGLDCYRLKRDVVRLHILANSDSAADQTVKLTVRDAVLEMNDSVFQGKLNAENAKNLIERNHRDIEMIADKILKDKGFSYKSHVYYTEEYFDTRVYDGFTLPAGKYKALKIELGKAQGHNWWCIMFPPLCLPAAESEYERENFCDEYRIVSDEGAITVRFKVVEWFEKIMNRAARY